MHTVIFFSVLCDYSWFQMSAETCGGHFFLLNSVPLHGWNDYALKFPFDGFVNEIVHAYQSG